LRETVYIQDTDYEESEEEDVYAEEYEPVDIEEDSDATVPVSSDDDEYPSVSFRSFLPFY